MFAACDPAVIDRPRRRFFNGRSLTSSYAMGLAVKDGDGEDDPSRLVQILSAQGTRYFKPGHCGYVFEGPEPPAEAVRFIVANNIPCIADLGALDEISDRDIIEVNCTVGRGRVAHFAASNDHTLALTNRCNSNCIICPDPENIRRAGHDLSLDWVARYLSLIQRDMQHICLTGGEPTLLQGRLFEVIRLCSQSLPFAQILLISNGRMFYYPDYASHMASSGAHRIIVAIALHSALPETHDDITGVPGSFIQTLRGIKNLIADGLGVEIRIVIQQANQSGLLDLSRLITQEANGILQVSFMGLELLGSAVINLDRVWVDIRSVTPELSRAIRHLMQNGIVPRIYNLPLCTVDSAYWSLCARSIAYHKRTYKAECVNCTVRDHCGGIFGTPLNHQLTQLRPIERSETP